ncbi:hypothetical protein IH574_02670, partial [Candidatus Bathyarchaeota archaeon]|nr:hypothetical protein [Candidatus Bathyarchaeota archaeon]
GYHLPAWVNENTLIYAVSYSGNTEETLSQYREAVDRGMYGDLFLLRWNFGGEG